MMDYAALCNYIDADATFSPWIAGGNDQQIADEINRRTVPVVGSVSRSMFAMWCGSSGLRVAIEDISSTAGHPLRAICLTLKDFLLGGVSDSLDMSNPINQAMLSVFVAADGITQAQAEELMALATSQQPVFGRQISNIDVACAFGRTGV